MERNVCIQAANYRILRAFCFLFLNKNLIVFWGFSENQVEVTYQYIFCLNVSFISHLLKPVQMLINLYCSLFLSLQGKISAVAI